MTLNLHEAWLVLSFDPYEICQKIIDCPANQRSALIQDYTTQARKVYHKLAVVFHPDLNGGDSSAAARFYLIKSAFDTVLEANNVFQDKFRIAKDKETELYDLEPEDADDGWYDWRV